MSLPFQAEKTSAGCFFTENIVLFDVVSTSGRFASNERSIQPTNGRFSHERSIQPQRAVDSKRGSSLASFTLQFTKTFHLFRFQELINSAKMFFHTLVTELIYFVTSPSRKSRSCETTISVPSKSINACFRISFVFMSRWLVGSSRISRLTGSSKSLIIASRVRSPPESTLTSSWILPVLRT